ncbi:MAG: hypothetical protein JW909_11700 [Planctomycetes bacterium]|nr:hypothetical protein [Planctomycetota bacterium]
MYELQDMTPLDHSAKAWVALEHWPDPLSYGSFARDILRLSGAETGEEKAIAVYRWLNRVFRWGGQYQEWSSMGWVTCDDLIKVLAIRGAHYCDGWGRVSSAIWNAGAMGAPVEKLVVWVTSGMPGHTMTEFTYEDADGEERGHAFDIFHQVSSRTRDGKRFATWDEVLEKDRTLWDEPTEPLEPFYYRPSQREGKNNTKYTTASHGLLVPPEHDLRHAIRPGTAITRYYDARFAPYIPGVAGTEMTPDECTFLHDPEGAYLENGDPVDPVNEPYWRPYLKKCETPGCRCAGKPVRFYASGEHVVKPPLDSTAKLQESSSHRLLWAKAAGGRLLEAERRQIACYVLPVECPYVLTEGKLTFRYVKKDERDWAAVQASPDGGLRTRGAWTAPKEVRCDGEEVALEFDLKEFLEGKPSVYGRYRFYLRFELLSHGDPGSCWFEDIEFRGKFMHNGFVSPRLLPGRNRYVLSGASAVRPVTLAMEWEEKGKAKKYGITAEDDCVTDNIVCGGREPYDIRMESVTLSG